MISGAFFAEPSQPEGFPQLWIFLWKTQEWRCKIMQDKENLNSWVEILRDINKKVDQNSYETWFEPTLYIGREKDILYIKVPNSYFKDWLSFHYSSLINESSEALFGKTYEIKYIFDDDPRAVHAALTRGTPLPARPADEPEPQP